LGSTIGNFIRPWRRTERDALEFVLTVQPFFQARHFALKLGKAIPERGL
jgi:hypothetical protein